MADTWWHIEKFAATRSIVLADGKPGTYVAFLSRGYWKYRFISSHFSYSCYKRYPSMESAIDGADEDAKRNTQ